MECTIREIGRFEIKGYIVRIIMESNGELNMTMEEDLLSEINIFKTPKFCYMGNPPKKVKKNIEIEVLEYEAVD